MDDGTKRRLEAYLCECIDNVLARKREEWDTDVPKVASFKPFHQAFLSRNMTKMADFERSFSTIMGLAFEGCAFIIAESRFETAEKQKETKGGIPTDTDAEIGRLVAEADKGNVFPNYESEVRRIVELARHDQSKLIEKSVISDLYVRDRDGNQAFFEMKTPKPNKEQCLNIIRKHLWIHCLVNQPFPRTRTCYGMSYNPYGEGNRYRYSFATKYLDFPRQVMLGRQFWDFLGGDNAYSELLQIFSHVGERKVVEIKRLIGE